MLRARIISAFEKIAAILEYKKDSIFKIRAYFRAIEKISGFQEEEFERLIVEKRLEEIEGIGKALAAKITEYYETGRIETLIRLQNEVPEGFFEMLKIRGLGAAQIRELHEKLGISNVSELEYACRENRLLKLKGFGEKRQANILKGIEFLKSSRELHLFADAEMLFNSLSVKLSSLPGVKLVVEGGAFARKCEVIRNIEVSILCEDVAHLETGIEQVLRGVKITRADGILILKHQEYPQINISATCAADFALTSLLFTCAEDLKEALAMMVHDRGIALPAFSGSTKEELDEAHKAIFKSLGIQYIPVELREDIGILELAITDRIPELVVLSDLRGVLHIHTTYSDGANDLKTMASACERLGYEYIGISDHSKSAFYAGGLKEEGLSRQHEEIDMLNRDSGSFRILKGIETEILPEGQLDYSQDVLKRFDFVIASVHSKFNMSEEEMTARIVRAVETGHVNILGHLTGRLLLGRDGYALDVEKVIKACAGNNTAIEINSDPMRLDLDWRYHALLKKHGVKTVISPDAHNVENLDFVRYGMNTARKGMLAKNDIINTMPYKVLIDFLGKVNYS